MSCILQIELGLVFWRQACQHAVEDSGFFQKVLLDFCALDCSGFVEENVDVLAEAG
jgi:hypothetical protein